MSIINRRFEKKEPGTVFRHRGSGKILCRLEGRLSQYDWAQLQMLFGLVYNSGVEQGSEKRASEIRKALGIDAGEHPEDKS